MKQTPEEKLAKKLAALVADLPEEITREDLIRHTWLRALVLSADDLANRVSRADLYALKSGWLDGGEVT